MTSALALFLVGLVALAGEPAGPPSLLEQNAATCESAGVAPETTISACKSLLQFGGLAPAEQAAIVFDLARGYDLKGETKRAIENYSAAIRLEPDLACAYYDCGRAYYAAGDYDRAVADNDATLRLLPDDPSALNNRGIAWLGEGKPDRAIADFDRAIALKPVLASTFYTRGFA